MNDIEKTVVEATFENMFARDLIRFILHEHMLGLQWTPTGIFAKQDLHSPFTSQLRRVVKEELDYNGHRLHRFYDELFQDKSAVETDHAIVCRRTKDNFLRGVTNIDFISFSVLIAMFAGLSYHYGANLAPDESYRILVTAVSELKLLGKVDEDLTNEMEFWLKRRDGYKRRWVSELPSDERQDTANPI